MDLRKILEKQIELLGEINERLKESDPEQVRRNIDTIDGLARTIHDFEFD